MDTDTEWCNSSLGQASGEDPSNQHCPIRFNETLEGTGFTNKATLQNPPHSTESINVNKRRRRCPEKTFRLPKVWTLESSGKLCALNISKALGNINCPPNAQRNPSNWCLNLSRPINNNPEATSREQENQTKWWPESCIARIQFRPHGTPKKQTQQEING